MEKTICDKCKKEIKGNYYIVDVWKGDTDEEIAILDVCPKCYKKIKVCLKIK